MYNVKETSIVYLTCKPHPPSKNKQATSKQVYEDIELIVLWMIICSTSFPTITMLLVNACSTAVLCIAYVGSYSPDDSMC